MTDTYRVEAADLTPQQASNLASKLLQFVTQRPVPSWKTTMCVHCEREKFS